jgi:nucleotide-binding universal stress UspA family protein
MIRKILAAIDGSEQAWKALDLAADIAKQHGARLIVLHVVPFEPVSDSLREFAAAEGLAVEEEAARLRYARTLGDSLTRSAEARSRDKGLTDIIGRTAKGRPADQILEAACGEGVDMIVMGSRGLSDTPRALFLGSVSHKVANHAACTCVTVK